jgi:GNAT superfamily N-acetyltransferase
MPTFEAQPPTAAAPPAGPFCQSLRLLDGQTEIGRALWFTADGSVVQILSLEVAPKHRRSGAGGLLYEELIRNARQLARQRRTPLRRVWIVTEQKSQIIGRAFLTKHGFHHTTTINSLLKGQDALVYQKAYD